MKPAVLTKFLPVTTTRPARIKATLANFGYSITMSYEAAEAAADAFAAQNGWASIHRGDDWMLHYVVADALFSREGLLAARLHPGFVRPGVYAFIID